MNWHFEKMSKFSALFCSKLLFFFQTLVRILTPGQYLEQLGLEAAQAGHADDLAALGDDRQLVEALPDHDVDGLLHRHAGQDGEGRREVEGAHLLVRPA